MCVSNCGRQPDVVSPAPWCGGVDFTSASVSWNLRVGSFPQRHRIMLLPQGSRWQHSPNELRPPDFFSLFERPGGGVGGGTIAPPAAAGFFSPSLTKTDPRIPGSPAIPPPPQVPLGASYSGSRRSMRIPIFITANDLSKVRPSPIPPTIPHGARGWKG